MAVRPNILGEAPVELWGVPSRKRLIRQLGHAGASDPLGPDEAISAEDSVLVIRADYLYDPRVLEALVKHPDTGLLAGESPDSEPLALHMPAERAAAAKAILQGTQALKTLPGFNLYSPTAIAPSYQAGLSKTEAPYALPIRPETLSLLEARLFHSAYKGVTDLITKFLWPLPCRWATRVAIHLGLRPNQITAAGAVLAVAVIFLFAQGLYGWGLALGWIMTFLDTVDGKLARVTAQSTRFGDILDHGLDLVHPPLWYIAWGIGLGTSGALIPGLSLPLAYTLILVGYILGRIAEGTFSYWLAPFQIFSWRPVDSWFRLIAARRNPNLILLTAEAIGRHPDWGLAAVTVWTVASTVFLGWRLIKAIRHRRQGPLRSWLAEIGPEAAPAGLTQRLFAHRPIAEAAN